MYGHDVHYFKKWTLAGLNNFLKNLVTQQAAYTCLLLTHWDRVMHIYVRKLTTIGSDNGLLPGRRQANIWSNVGILLIRPLGTNFSEIFTKIYTFSFKKIHLKMSSGKWQPSCFCLNLSSHRGLDKTADIFRSEDIWLIFTSMMNKMVYSKKISPIKLKP